MGRVGAQVLPVRSCPVSQSDVSKARVRVGGGLGVCVSQAWTPARTEQSQEESGRHTETEGGREGRKSPERRWGGRTEDAKRRGGHGHGTQRLPTSPGHIRKVPPSKK